MREQKDRSSLDIRIRAGALVALQTHAAAVGLGGRLVYLVGDPGSGRSATLEAFVRGLGRDRSGPAVTAVRFEGPNAVVPMEPSTAWRSLRRRTMAALPAVGAVGSAAAVAPILVPSLVTVAVAAQLAQALADVGNVAEQLTELQRRIASGDPDALLSTLRIAARTGPVICILDDFFRADPTWWRLFLRDGVPELAQLPVLLVAAVDLHEREDRALFTPVDLAEGLGDGNFTHVIAVDPADAEEVEAQVGPLQEPLRTDLLALVGSAAGFVEDLWQELRRTDAVEWQHERWRWAGGAQPADAGAAYLGLVRQLLDRRIRARCPSLEQRELATAFVRMAALEGQRFTPAAIVGALQAMGVEGCENADTVLDFFDDVLASGEAPQRIFDAEERPMTWRAGTDRFAYRATFVNAGLAESLRRYGLRPEEKRRWAEALGHALERTYRGAEPAVYATLADVWAQADNDLRAAWALRQQIGPSARDRVESLMTGLAAGRFEQLAYVAYSLNIIGRLKRSDPPRAENLGQKALVAAESTGEPRVVLLVLLAITDLLRTVFRFADALPYIERAAEIAGSGGGQLRWWLRFQLASCHLGLDGKCGCSTDHLAVATALSDELLPAAIAGSESHRLVTAFQGALLVHRGDHEAAILAYRRAVVAAQRAGDRGGRLAYLNQVGYCLYTSQRYSEATSVYGELGQLAQQIGDSLSAATALHQQTFALHANKQLREARESALCAVEALDIANAPLALTVQMIDVLRDIAARLGQSPLAAELLELGRLAAAPAEQTVTATAVLRQAVMRDLPPTLRRLHQSSL